MPLFMMIYTIWLKRLVQVSTLFAHVRVSCSENKDRFKKQQTSSYSVLKSRQRLKSNILQAIYIVYIFT